MLCTVVPQITFTCSVPCRVHDQEKLSISSKFDCALTTTILNVLQLQLLEPVRTLAIVFQVNAKTYSSLFALSMEVDPFDASGHLVEADVVETFETRTVYGFDAMVRNQEVLLPAHKKMLLLHPVL
jgi:hypothetical protein